ncbi:MAG: hypothetical protein ISQ87_09560 [Rhodobacteraceae bacterium]|nr:hypothetical protein [Paracoccaceae bacterium]MBL6789524.1 hypothetical protein [Paracoccaceae bacterium]MBL6860213.1 hypothetical protein [Paracoccaceae bacterium]
MSIWRSKALNAKAPVAVKRRVNIKTADKPFFRRKIGLNTMRLGNISAADAIEGLN